MDHLAALQNLIASIRAALADDSLGDDERQAIAEGARHLSQLMEGAQWRG